MSFQGELEDDLASDLNTQLGLTLFKGIVRQFAFTDKPEIGQLLYGETKTPFVSLTSTVPVRYIEAESFTSIASTERIVTVGLCANKADVEKNWDAYRDYKQSVEKLFNMNRIRGSFASDANSCVLSMYARPRSQFEEAAWRAHGKWVSAVDVLFRCREAVRD